ncbi:unnamed protein product [Effrenium voratum]|nr:unnamed protein product [Effrenium voratum]
MRPLPSFDCERLYAGCRCEVQNKLGQGWNLEAMSDTQRIFVSIASYRDSQCQYTIQDLFQKAKSPGRVVVGVCFQVAPEDADNFLIDLNPWCKQIRTCFLPHREAKGPCYARWLIQQELFQDECYYFQIDSHMRFVQDWDDICLEQLEACSNPERGILTTYGSSYTLPRDYMPGGPDVAELAPNKALPILCADVFEDGDDPFLRIKSRSSRTDFGHAPPPALFWTARFAFSPGSVVREVPYDPHLEYVFFGEEISMAARLWTSGWDFFNPSREIAYHLASRAHRYWFREVQTGQHQRTMEEQGKFRICGMLGTEWQGLHQAPERPYGLGLVRTLTEYEAFAGVDFSGRRLDARARLGGQRPEVFGPTWADEQREGLLRSAQLKDVQSWAGKGADAQKAQVPQQAKGEDERPRALARLRIHSLRSQPDSGLVQLELCKALAALAELEASSGQTHAADAACKQAELHLRNAKADGDDLRASCCLAEAMVRMSQGSFDVAKRLLHQSLQYVAQAFSQEALQLACEIVEAIHTVHERTDDRKGLRVFHEGLKCLLGAIRALDPEPCQEVPQLTANHSPPDGQQLDPVAQLLERMVLVLVATGCDQDMDVVKSVFQQFRVARESPGLLRLLAMLQSSGHLL